MTDEEREAIAHSFGLHIRRGKRRRWSFRNHWYGQREICDDMTIEGLMVRYDRGVSEAREPETWYKVTDAGITAAGFDGRVRKEDRIK